MRRSGLGVSERRRDALYIGLGREDWVSEDEDMRILEWEGERR